MDLAKQRCVPCREGAPKLTRDELQPYLESVSSKWQLDDQGNKLKREFEFADFAEAIIFIDQVAQIAEKEGHHPNLHLHDYKKVRVELWTHKIGGLHANDFILAAKIDQLVAGKGLQK